MPSDPRNPRREQVQRASGNAYEHIQREADRRGHGNRTAVAAVGAGLGAAMGSFGGPLGALAGGALGGWLGSLVGRDMDRGGR